MKTRIGALTSAMLLASSTGCYTTWDIPHRELEKLNGYQPPVPVELQTWGDKAVKFDPDAKLWLRVENDSRWIKTAVATASTDGPILTVLRPGTEGPLRVDLREVGLVKVARFSEGKTAGLAIGTALGAALVATVIVGVVMLNQCQGQRCL